MRATLVAAALVMIAGCANANGNAERVRAHGVTSTATPDDTIPYGATVTFGRLDGGRPLARLLLGNNVQWVDNGDDLFEPGTNREVPRMLDLAVALHPTLLRYPGGSLADTYHWQSGMGPISERRPEEHFHTKRRQPVTFGTVEFLTLCRQLGAEPMITVNVASGTAQEAAEWVRAVNRGTLAGPDGVPLGPVRYWEIGNEPYLREDARKELAVAPETYARRANDFIRAMKAIDPAIRIGLPLRSDTVGAMPATPFQGFNDKVLAAVTAPYEFVSLHDAYLPILWDRSKHDSDNDVFRATMAATRVVEQDLAVTRRLLHKYQPGRDISIAITEYNTLYSLGGGRDDYITSLASALYVGDLLRLLAQTDDVPMANYWSLNGNWYFGAITTRGDVRPAYYVLQLYDRAIRGRLVKVDVAAPSFSTPAVGAVSADTGLPLITAFASLDNDTLRLVVINKDASKPARLTLQGPSRVIAAAQRSELSGPDVFHARSPLVKPLSRALAAKSFPLLVNLPPHSLTLLEFRLAH